LFAVAAGFVSGEDADAVVVAIQPDTVATVFVFAAGGLGILARGDDDVAAMRPACSFSKLLRNITVDAKP